MDLFNIRNVTEALPRAIQIFEQKGLIQDSRGGKVYTLPYPVITCYSHPLEKVLFNKYRDANPFFHLMEAMWMLNGDEDSWFLDHYVHDFGQRFANEGIVRGAYGYRWKWLNGINQIDEVIKKLKKNSLDRQTVIQIWDATMGHDDLRDPYSKDRPCNTQIYVRIVNDKLDLTTTARSHDAIWGAAGANAVHFTFLQEYIAGKLNISVGKFYQFSNNYHMYVETYDKLKDKLNLLNKSSFMADYLRDDRYINGIKPLPLMTNPDSFDKEFIEMMSLIRRMLNLKKENDTEENKFWDSLAISSDVWKNKFLSETVLAVAETHWIYKNHDIDMAIDHTYFIEAEDWRLACREWLERRKK